MNEMRFNDLALSLIYSIDNALAIIQTRIVGSSNFHDIQEAFETHVDQKIIKGLKSRTCIVVGVAHHVSLISFSLEVLFYSEKATVSCFKRICPSMFFSLGHFIVRTILSQLIVIMFLNT